MPKKQMRKQESTQELTTIIDRDMKDLKDKIKAAGKRKGQQRRQIVHKLERAEVRNVSNLIMSFENAIYMKEEEDEYNSCQELKSQYDEYKERFEKLKRELEFIRNQGRKEDEIYKNRGVNELNTKEQYAQKIETAQKDSQAAVKNMLRMLYEQKDIGTSVNVQLQRQMQALDSINTSLRDTETTMNRALRHINYFARSVYTDKLLIVLMVLIVLAVVAVIILSAMGKVGSPEESII